MKNFITIGDLHGSTAWREVAKKVDEYDKIVFLGDYTDSFTHLNIEIKDNLSDIIDFKKKYPEKIELLWGNHDICYVYDDAPLCSGHRRDMKAQLKADLIDDNKDLFKIAYQYENYLWTHAGVSNKWAKTNEKHLQDNADRCNNLADILNNLSQTTEGRAVLFTIGRIRGGWEEGGPLWADKSETDKDFLKREALKEFHQIVGHSKVRDIVTETKEYGSITYCDVLDTVKKFYELKIN